MAHFAELDENNIVKRVLVVDNSKLLDNGVEAEEKGIDFLKRLFGKDTRWVQTSYNGKFREKYAGAGDLYDATNDRFVDPRTL